MLNWHQLKINEVEAELKTNITTGLTSQEAKLRLTKFGPNLLNEVPPESWISVFLRQFKSPLIYLLVVCCVAVFFIGDGADAIIILVVLLVNAVIGTVQEGRSGRILESLKKLSSTEATVLRDGREILVTEAAVVPGDILLLKEGEKVVADSRLVAVANLGAEEAMLTGESGAIVKHSGALNEETLPASGKRNIIFKGTNILTGSGKAIVFGTGQKTEMGKIASSVQLAQEEIPLQKNIRNFSKLLVRLALGISAVVFFLGIFFGHSAKEMFSLVVSLTVSIIPEGLPLVLTVILVTGVYRMSKKNALVKKMQAVEALGQASVIAVDKTGTITRNEMVVKKLFMGSRVYEISGNGYESKGIITLGKEDKRGDEEVLWAATLASLSTKGQAVLSAEQGVYKVIGDPTEAAAQVFGEKLGKGRQELLKNYNEILEVPFDYKNKYRAVFFGHGEKVLCAVLGSTEVLLKDSVSYFPNPSAQNLSEAQEKLILGAEGEFASQGLRAVAFAYKWIDKTQKQLEVNKLVFGGIFGIEDSVRKEAIQAVSRAQALGVKIVMITGDHKETAKAIAREAGIYKEGDNILTGQELFELSENEIQSKIKKVCVFARVTPEDKMHIIRAYKKAGEVIAMTGDGVNDVPPLVAADLGVAMGKIGTEVAKEAADIILLDDNLMSIVSAISEGRVMYQNIKKSLQFLFSTSLGEILTIVAALFLNLPLPVLAVQIIWMNLVTDPLLGAALATEKKEHEFESRPHKGFSKYFIDMPMVVHMLLVGSIMAVAGIWVFSIYKDISEPLARTVALTLLCSFQWLNAFNCRFLDKSILHKRIFSNPYVWLAFVVNIILQLGAVYLPFMQRILKTTPLGLREWILVAALSFSVIFVEEIRKVVYRVLRSALSSRPSAAERRDPLKLIR